MDLLGSLVWRRATDTEKHEADKVIYDAETDSHWVNLNYSLDDFANSEVFEGFKNPRYSAHKQMCKELRHYLSGHVLEVTASLSASGVELVSESITTDFSFEYWDCEETCAERCARHNFNIRSMIKDARAEAERLSGELGAIAPNKLGDLQRYDLERMAMLAINKPEYYELRDNLDGLTDEQLVFVCQWRKLPEPPVSTPPEGG